jgi:hypothetical protein
MTERERERGREGGSNSEGGRKREEGERDRLIHLTKKVNKM